MSGIYPQDLLQVQDAAEQTVLIDVRSAAEFESVRIPGSHSLPLDLLQQKPDAVAANLPAGSVLLCQSGVRSQQALTAVSAAGGGDAQVLVGGINAYEDAGGKLLHGRSTWSMERQVRMAAGGLVAAGVLGGRLIHPKLTWLSFGVGSGLIFAAASNTCGMAYALSRMPWNRAEKVPTLDSALASIAETPPSTP